MKKIRDLFLVNTNEEEIGVNMKLDITCICDGKGYWSRCPYKWVRVKSLNLGYVNDEVNFGELRAYFDKRTWNVDRHGLIYTDGGWLKYFRNGLLEYGFPKEAVEDINYSEQGMQGKDFVSMDVGKIFLRNYILLNGDK